MKIWTLPSGEMVEQVEYELANTSAAIFMTRVLTWAKIPGAT